MYNGLVTLGKDLEIEPELAKSWAFSKDCLTLDFKLQRGREVARRRRRSRRTTWSSRGKPR